MTLVWRACPKCGKSFDGVYVAYFGCRSCGFAEPIEGVVYQDLVGPAPALLRPQPGRPKHVYRAESGVVVRAQ